MAGAVVTHLRFGEPLIALVPLALLVLVAIVGYVRRPGWQFGSGQGHPEPGAVG